jgi:hypothetical protein
VTDTLPFPAAELARAGLNLYAVFNLDQLPRDIIDNLSDNGIHSSAYRQLILVGHGGPELWQALQQTDWNSPHPIDHFTLERVNTALNNAPDCSSFSAIYPGDKPVGLQRLGELAGWHHATPFKVGINPQWGSWFAYRAAYLADSNFATTAPLPGNSPCASCSEKPCVSNCPANALEGGEFNLKRCIDYRLTKESPCREHCLARLSCPVGREHRYSREQVKYHYGVSMAMIESWQRK